MPTRKEAERRMDEHYGGLESEGRLSEMDRETWEAAKRLRQPSETTDSDNNETPS